MSDVKHVLDSKGTYGFEDTVAREKASALEQDVTEIKAKVNNMSVASVEDDILVIKGGSNG